MKIKLLKYIKGPDFPTGKTILGRRDHTAGQGGIIKTRALAQIERLENGKARIVVTELPFQVNKAKTMEIANWSGRRK